jgi:hypothetical protein
MNMALALMITLWININGVSQLEATQDCEAYSVHLYNSRDGLF